MPNGSWLSTPAGSRRRAIVLLNRVADREPGAFARLSAALTPAVAAQLRSSPLSRADVEAITAATLLEVWWLARFHRTSDTDIWSWIADIADRRARERLELLSADAAVPAGDRPDADGTGRDPVAADDDHNRRLYRGLVRHG